MAEISVPAWPIPIHQTKLMMAKPQPTGMLMPQTPTPLMISQVAKRKAEERDYQVLADLNYRPRTTYTAGVINPNPELA